MKEFRLIWILILPDNLLLTDYFSLKLLFIIYGGFFEYITHMYISSSFMMGGSRA